MITSVKAAAVAFITVMLLGSIPNTVSASMLTVDGVDYPVCQFEDCSDQPNQIGIWVDGDTGNQWLSIGEESFLVVR